VNGEEYKINDKVTVTKGQFEGTSGYVVYVRKIGNNGDNWDYSVKYNSGEGHWHYGHALKRQSGK
jgi:hypothetical protein